MIAIQSEFWRAASLAGLSDPETLLLLMIADSPYHTHQALQDAYQLSRPTYFRRIEALKKAGCISIKSTANKSGRFSETKVYLDKRNIIAKHLIASSSPSLNNETRPSLKNETRVSKMRHGEVSKVRHGEPQQIQGFQPENTPPKFSQKSAGNSKNTQVFAFNPEGIKANISPEGVYEVDDRRSKTRTSNNTITDNSKKQELNKTTSTIENKESKVEIKKARNLHAEFAQLYEQALQKFIGRKFPNWRPRDIKHISRLRAEIQDHLEAHHDRPATDDETVAAFTDFLRAAATANQGWFLKNHFTPSGLESQFQKIVNHVTLQRKSGSASQSGVSQGGTSWSAEFDQKIDSVIDWYDQRDADAHAADADAGFAERPHTAPRTGEQLGEHD